MSSDDRYATNFEQLLRWIYDKPTFVMPALGEMPQFLKDDAIVSPTRIKAKRAAELTRNSGASAPTAIDAYFDSLVAVLEQFRVKPDHADFPQATLDSIDGFLPYRDEFIEFMFAAAPASGPALAQVLQRFFERAIPFMSKPASISSWRTWDFDNFSFVVHELFLYAIAILLRYERYDTIAEFLSLRFYVPNESKPGETMRSFSVIWKPLDTLRQKSTELRRVSLRSDLLQKRSHGSGVQFATIMTADFILFLRSAVTDDDQNAWYPETLMFAYEVHGAFEVFARAESTAYFKRLTPSLGIATKDQLEKLISTYSTDGRAGRWLPRSTSSSRPTSSCSALRCTISGFPAS